MMTLEPMQIETLAATLRAQLAAIGTITIRRKNNPALFDETVDAMSDADVILHVAGHPTGIGAPAKSRDDVLPVSERLTDKWWDEGAAHYSAGKSRETLDGGGRSLPGRQAGWDGAKRDKDLRFDSVTNGIGDDYA